MAVTSKDLGNRTIRERLHTMLLRPFNPLAYFVTFILAALAIYLLVGAVVDWGRIKLDDVRYGRPRTMHLSGITGIGEESGQPSHFIAMNLNRQVVVLILPGGDSSRVQHLPGPYLFGAGEDLTPVQLELRDVDNNGYNDLLISVREELVVYLNKDGAFRLPDPEEQRQLILEQSP